MSAPPTGTAPPDRQPAPDVEAAPTRTAPHPRAGAVAAATTLVLVGVLLVGSVFYSLPSNVLSTRDGGSVRAFSAHLLPQNWGFFTKPPSDPELVPYRVAPDGRLAPAGLLPNSRSSNLFGVSRRQRAQGPELAALAAQVTTWTTCDRSSDCRATTAQASPSLPVHNTSPVATLCGALLLVETSPVPWTFRHDYVGWRLDDKAALVQAACA